MPSVEKRSLPQKHCICSIPAMLNPSSLHAEVQNSIELKLEVATNSARAGNVGLSVKHPAEIHPFFVEFNSGLCEVVKDSLQSSQ